MKLTYLLIVASLFIFYSCSNKTSNTTEKKDSVETVKVIKLEYKDADMSKNNAVLISDSIAYPVVVKNPDKADEWTTECLKHLNLKALITIVFDAVYAGKLTPYNYQTENVMTIEEVKELEAKFKREQIGKVLFVEEWFFDEKALKMGKRVNAIMLAYELYDANLNVKNYKAGIKVYLTDESKNKKK